MRAGQRREQGNRLFQLVSDAEARPVSRLPVPSMIRTGRPAISTRKFDEFRESRAVPPSRRGISSGAPDPYRLAGSSVESRTGSTDSRQLGGRSGQPLDGLGLGVLDPGEPLDEVPPAQLAPHLRPREPGGQVPPGGCPRVEPGRLTSQDAIAIEQGRGPGEMGRLGIVGRSLRDQGPAPLGPPRCRPAERASPASEGRSRRGRQCLDHRLAAGSERVEAVVGRPGPSGPARPGPAEPRPARGRSPGQCPWRSSPLDGRDGRAPWLRVVSAREDPLGPARGRGNPERRSPRPGSPAPDRLGPPGPVARAERLVEPRGPEVADPSREQFRLPEFGRCGEPLQLLQSQADGRDPLRAGCPGGRAGGGRRSRRTPRAERPRSPVAASRSRAGGPPPGSADRPSEGRRPLRPGRAGPGLLRRRTVRAGPSPAPDRSGSEPSGRPGRSGRGPEGSGGRWW